MFLAALALIAPALQELQYIDPKTYKSDAGTFTLYVNPTEKYGDGPADCAFYKSGKLVWKSRLPYTILDAQVTENGDICGYTYTFEKGSRTNYLHILILDSTGKARLDQKLKRVYKYLHEPSVPFVRSIAASSLTDRFLVALGDEKSKILAYQISDGKETTLPIKQLPEEDFYKTGIEMSYLPGTNLLLQARIWLADRGMRHADYSLVSPDGKVVWQAKGDDIAPRGSDERWYGPWIESTSRDHFSVQTTEKWITTYKVVKGQVVLDEQKRVPESKPAMPNPPEVPLKELTPLKLIVPNTGVQPEIHDV